MPGIFHNPHSRNPHITDCHERSHKVRDNKVTAEENMVARLTNQPAEPLPALL